MTGVGHPMLRTVDAQPFACSFLPARTAVLIIDMQRDIVEPGDFGAPLGNDTALLREAVPSVRGLLDLARKAGMTVVHTRECHRPDLPDCLPSKRDRGRPLWRSDGMGIADP